jgi:hypothetical protein
MEDWEYSCMLMYLAANTRPDISYAVHQEARQAHAPRSPPSVPIKRILHYLKGTRTKGILFKPDDSYRVDFYVEANFRSVQR